ncbi:hypothetical protein EHW66_13600 [Erwinia psidii]|uniref:hypothetical protein n=1 Tax=Erwinia psidii TaxID=69224 RepID=UPI00226B6EFB|nr:hypothetical protein [Erwinia psidii]MCX8965987.1 hypothetical protein [Erwinia psidii]
MIPSGSKHSAIPDWVTIDEAVNVINQQTECAITESKLWRYALYRHLTLSIYFQSPVTLRRVQQENGRIVLMKNRRDLLSRISMLSTECFICNNAFLAKTEGDYITPDHHVIDTPLLGHECVVLQKLLARSLNIPTPKTGQCNIYCGILVHDGDHLYQLFENISVGQQISRQLNQLSASKAKYYHYQIERLKFNRHRTDYFPVYQFPDDACFVIRRAHLENFIRTFTLPLSPVRVTHQISTPLSRLLWLACKHNDTISPLIDHPYKLISIFEQWAASDGITDRLSGDTLKKALRRGCPV